MDNQNQQSVQQPISPSAEPSLPPPSPKPNMLIMGTGAIILLVIGLIGGYLLKGMNIPTQPKETKQIAQISPVETEKVSPSPVPTTIPSPSSIPQIPGWKVYVNEKNGYSLQYPTDKVIRFQCPDEELTIDYKTSSDQRKDGELMPTCGRDGRYTIEGKTYTDEYTPPTFEDHYDIKKEDVTFNGNSAIQYTYSMVKPFLGQSPPDWFQEVLIKKNNKTYEFYLGNKDHQTVFDQILSTIVFKN